MPPFSSPLYKQKSWSPDLHRDEEWMRRKGKHLHRRRRKTKSVTDEDIDELKACIELGFGFDRSPELDDRLSTTLPALGFYYAVNKQYHDTISKSSSMSSSSSSSISFSSAVSEPDLSSPWGSPHTIINRGKFTFWNLNRFSIIFWISIYQILDLKLLISIFSYTKTLNWIEINSYSNRFYPNLNHNT